MTNETASPAQSGILDQERLLVALAYGLYLISPAGGLPLLAGVIIAMVRKSHAQGTIYESHYRNLILVFFVMLGFASLLLAAATGGLLSLLFGIFTHPDVIFWQLPLSVMLIPAAALASLLLGLWFYWRVLRGLIHALDEKPY